MAKLSNCHDCGAKPGAKHLDGCDVARCPRCGHQRLSCDCIYIVNGMNPATQEETHPAIYTDGPTDAMYAVWDREWGGRAAEIWTGEWPGKDECREYGFWCVGPPWVSVPAGTPG